MEGEVIAVNERLYENLDILSNDPYVHGWLIKFKTKERHVIDELLSAQNTPHTLVNRILLPPKAKETTQQGSHKRKAAKITFFVIVRPAPSRGRNVFPPLEGLGGGLL